MKTFFIKSQGCKQNQLEGQIISSELKKAGYIEVKTISKADIYILNSCSVTSHSDSQAKYLLGCVKRKNPNIKTVLVGCLAQTYEKHKDFNYKNIDLVLGNIEKINIEKYIDKLFYDGGFFVDDIFKQKEFNFKFLKNPDTTRVSVKIQDGCNNRCSYCIIPFARGNSRSNSIKNILKQIKIIVDSGIKEVVLTGIHIGQWGLEFNKKLIDLLKEIEKTDIQRYRLGSLYVNEIDDELISFLSESDKFCPHFHLSVQSLCDKTLKEMNRNYNTEDVFQIVEKLKKNFRLPFLGCDIIVGFPGETDEDFNITFKNLKKLKLSSIHCFPYSKREGTSAFYKNNQIQNSIKTKRVNLILNLSKELHKEFLNQNKNTKAQILIEKKSEKTGLYSAITKNYIKLYIKDDNNNLRHTIKTVNLNDFELF